MTDKQWEVLVNTINGELVDPLPIGFIIDSPWLPNWYGINILDYFTSDQLWLEANFKAIESFPDVIFLPGFWSEYGMCTEPSAFGSRCNFPLNEFPHAHKMINSADEIDTLPVPNPKTDGLLPLVLNRLRLAQGSIEERGHKIRFAVSRGPLNIASYLMGSTEFLSAMMLTPDKAHNLISKVTSFVKDWLKLQMETFPTIDGIFLLDDIIGFMGPEDFSSFGLSYFKDLYDLDVKVKFLHNDAPCAASAPYLTEMGINLFNMGFDVTLNDLKTATNNKITLVGNLPPRDVLAQGSGNDIEVETNKLISSLDDKSRIIMSCGGGMPPGVPTENISTFINTVRKYNAKK